MDLLTITTENVTGYNDKFYKCFIDQEFTDTELVLEDGRIKVHSIVLAAASETLYKMLKSQTELQKTLILTNFNKERMRYILEIIYKGSVFFPRVFENEINQDIKFFELKGINIAKDKLPTHFKFKSDSANLSLSPVRKTTLRVPTSKPIKIVNKSPTKQNDESDNSLDFLSPQFEANSTAQNFSPTALSKEQNNKSVTDNNCRTPSPSNVNITLYSSDETMWNDSSGDDISDHQTNSVQKVKNPFSPKRRKVLPLSDDKETSDSSKNSKTFRNKVKASSSSNKNTDINTINFWTKNKKGWTTKEKTLSSNYCTVCNKDIYNIKDHIKVIHKKLIRFPVYACEICEAKFYYKSMKKWHQTLCKNEER